MDYLKKKIKLLEELKWYVKQRDKYNRRILGISKKIKECD